MMSRAFALPLFMVGVAMTVGGGHVLSQLNRQPPPTQMVEFHPWYLDPHPELKCVADPPLAEILDTGRSSTITCMRRDAFETAVSPLGQGDLWVPVDPYALSATKHKRPGTNVASPWVDGMGANSSCSQRENGTWVDCDEWP